MMSKHDYSGMTVNQRLSVSGLLVDFDSAANNRDPNRMIAILKKVELDSNQAQETTDAILKNPSKYGY